MVASNSRSSWVCGRRISLFRHLQHIGTIKQQSMLREKPQSQMADKLERQEAPNDAKNEDRGKNRYTAAFA